MNVVDRIKEALFNHNGRALDVSRASFYIGQEHLITIHHLENFWAYLWKIVPIFYGLKTEPNFVLWHIILLHKFV